MTELEVTKRIEGIFFTLAQAEGITTEEIADRGYMDDKLDAWYECGFISQHEHDVMKANWGIK